MTDEPPTAADWLDDYSPADWLEHLAAARARGVLGPGGVDVDAGLRLLWSTAPRASDASPGGPLPPTAELQPRAAAEALAARQAAARP